jgi:L-cysteine:1D-myo-inositol 2-amino-2-deoxy-alpha-D-glucopyranoside ligase
MYVCGITPYDATHLGHAATYLTYDLIHRVLLDGGHRTAYVQNVTDIDDDILKRAGRPARTGPRSVAARRRCSAPTSRRSTSCRPRTTSAPSSR